MDRQEEIKGLLDEFKLFEQGHFFFSREAREEEKTLLAYKISQLPITDAEFEAEAKKRGYVELADGQTLPQIPLEENDFGEREHIWNDAQNAMVTPIAIPDTNKETVWVKIERERTDK